jgi:two-component system, cell cycle sensor histidine kinase and response regulator CckA
LGQILKAGKRAAGLVRQLLTFSRRQIIKPTVINFNELMLSMHKMLRHMLGENIEVVALPVENLWSVQLDPGQFEQVIANLAVNARDAMSAGGKFVMKTENMVVDESYASTRPGMRPGEYVLFSCQDTGSGMSEEVKKRIFEPFFTTKGPGKGTGLGLATCYGMVKQAGGYIEVESELGKGTVFKIYLPRVFGQVTSLEEVGGPEALPKGSETIFLVEDEILVRDLIVSVLKNQGYQILTASNGSEALYLMEEWPNQKIDLLLTDIVMPKMGGRELAERMSKIRPGIKILFMSGYIDDETIHSSVMEASVAFLPKPITPSALAFKVREVLDGKMGEAAASSKVS